MENDCTIKDLTETVERASTDFEKTNTELKRKYLVWNIEVFNIMVSKVSGSMGSFGTGYPFYALDRNLKGKLPIIQEQIRYNRALVKDGIRVQNSIWKCKSCLRKNYSNMLDLKTVCKPCPNMINELKPRKIINRLPDLDMWMICKDSGVCEAQKELSVLLEKYNMRTSDVDPLAALEDVSQISKMLKEGKKPKIFLPIDAHIIEYSKLKNLIKQVPEELNAAKREERIPYLPIHPRSYRKKWQYDDEAYNFIYDFLSAFTEFNFPEELQQCLDEIRLKVATEYSTEELFNFLLSSATEANFRRFQSIELEEMFCKRITEWKLIKERSRVSSVQEVIIDDVR